MAGEAEATEERIEERDLIGRSRELGRITDAYRQAARGAGSLTVVSGGAGLGKSRLLEAAATAAVEEQLTVVAARCWLDGGAPPLWPWQPIVRDLCGPEAADLLAGDDDLFARFSTIAEHLVAATAKQPACLMIDDIHAADAGSLLLLRFVVRASPRPRLAVVVSRRTCAQPAGLREARLLDELAAEAVPIVLLPFDGDETARFLQAHGLACAPWGGGSGSDDLLLKAAHQVCLGRPAQLRRLAAEAIDLIDGVRRTARRCVAGLTEEHRTVLQAAAVVGASPPVADIAALAGCERSLVLESAAAGAQAGLMRGVQPTQLHFGNELIRAELEYGLSAPERIGLHARAAALVLRADAPAGAPEESGADADAAADAAKPADDGSGLAGPQVLRWAYHAIAAAPRSPADTRVAIAACRAGTDVYVANRALGDADALISVAVELHDHDSRTLGAPPASLLVDWARAALRRGLLSEARSRFERAAAAAEQEDDPECLAEAALGLGGQWVNEIRTPLERARVLGLQRDARFRLATGGSGDEDEDDDEGRGRDEAAWLRARLDVRLAAEAVYDGHPVEPVLAALGRVRAQSGGDRRALAEALSLTHHVLLAPEHAELRLGLADELIRVAAGIDPALGVIGLCWRTIDLFLLGSDQATRSLEVLRQHATDLDHRSALYMVDLFDVLQLVRAGRLDEAEAAAQKAHHRGQVIGEVDAFGYLGIGLLVIRWLQDRHGELADAAESMVGSATVATGEFAFRASAAVAAGRAGRLDRARAELDALLADGMDALPASSSWLTGLTSIVELALLLDDATVAHQAYDRIAPYAGRPVLPSLAVMCLGSAERWLGLAAQIWGDLDLACHHLERAVQANLALGHHPMVAMTRAELAGALLARRASPGDAERAAELLELAVAAAVTMGMPRRAADWRELLAADAAAPPAAPAPLVPMPVPSPPPVRSEPRQGHIRRRGRGWLIALDERRVGLPELVGMGYLVELLRNPGRRISALALISGPAALPAVLDQGDHHDLLDDKARAAYGERLMDLTAELDEAESHADRGRAERLRVEIDALIDQLEEATGLSGRSRSFAHSPERARTAVRKAITRALDRIDAADPVVGTALRTVIVTGTSCSYEPTADSATTWTAELTHAVNAAGR